MLGIHPFDALPDWIGEFSELQELNLYSCFLTSLLSSLGQCGKLEHLNLTNNPLKILPEFARGRTATVGRGPLAVRM